MFMCLCAERICYVTGEISGGWPLTQPILGALCRGSVARRRSREAGLC